MPFWCCSYRYAFTIERFIKFIKIMWINLYGKRISPVRNRFVIWFVSTFQSKSKFDHIFMFASITIETTTWKDLNCSILCSWFLDSIEVYSPFVLVQMISCTVILAVCILYIDLVWKFSKCIPKCTWINIHSTLFYAVISSHGCIDCNNSYGSFNCHFESVRLLLFWTIGHWKFWTNERIFILRFALVQTADKLTKIHRHHNFNDA